MVWYSNKWIAHLISTDHLSRSMCYVRFAKRIRSCVQNLKDYFTSLVHILSIFWPQELHFYGFSTWLLKNLEGLYFGSQCVFSSRLNPLLYVQNPKPHQSKNSRLHHWAWELWPQHGKVRWGHVHHTWEPSDKVQESMCNRSIVVKLK